MLTDKDFDDIGKRLYDLEADPPEKGWNRIAADIIPPPPSGRGKGTFLGRHWWKGLLIVLPFTIYILWPVEKTATSGLDRSAIVEGVNKRNADENGMDHAGTEVGAELKGRAANRNAGVSDKPIDESLAETVESNALSENRNSSMQPGAGNTDKKTNQVRIQPHASGIDEAIDDGIGAKITRSPAGTEDPNHTGGDAQKDDNSPASLQPVGSTGIGKAADSPVASAGSDDQDVETKDQARLPKDDEVTLGLSRLQKPVAVDVHQDNNNEILAEATEKTNLDEGKDEVLGRDASAHLKASSSTESDMAPTLQDSVLVNDEIDMTRTPVVVAGEESEPETREKLSSWRLSAAVAPQFSYKSVKPIGNDEVLVTNIRTSSKYPERVGLGFALGAGKEVAHNLYLDFQLTHTRTSQTFEFDYATGKVDTLLAVQDQNGSVRVIPVYEVSDRQLRSTLGYAGIRTTATHYFWQRGKRRFNITAGAGFDAMVWNLFEEKIDGVWTRYENVPANKTNFNFTLGAGYNVALGSGWEIMFSPMLTYYGRKIETNQQPFHFLHRTYSLNIGLFKSLK